MSNLLTASRMRAYRECPKKHEYLYVKGYRPAAKEEALAFGTLWHDAMERFYLWFKDPFNTANIALPYSAAHTAAFTYLDHRLVGPSRIEPFTASRLRAMLLHYVNSLHASKFFERYKVVSVEHEFLQPLINPDTLRRSETWVSAGKIDVLLQDKATARYVVMEHKTTDDAIEGDSPYWGRLMLDAQISQYVVAAEAMFDVQVDQVIYDVVRKLKIRPLRRSTGARYRKPATAEERSLVADHPRLQRRRYRENDETVYEYELRCHSAIARTKSTLHRMQHVARTDSMIRDYMRNAWATAKMMRADELNGWAIHNPDACHRWGLCPFWRVCVKQADLDSNKFIKLDNVHPELSIPLEPRSST